MGTPLLVVNMPAYHSSISNENCRIIGNVPLLPLKETCKGRGVKSVAPVCNNNTFDIVDESLDLFKANILFDLRNQRQIGFAFGLQHFVYSIMSAKIGQNFQSRGSGSSGFYASSQTICVAWRRKFPFERIFSQTQKCFGGN